MNGENDTMYYVHKDYLGSYDVITDKDGKVLERLSFDPWGRRRNPVDWTFNHVLTYYIFDRGYTGHEHLDVFSLINMNGRVYDPWLGRFLSPDPIVQSPGYSQSYNRYSYCFNNPLKYCDPSGFDVWDIIDELMHQPHGGSWSLGEGTYYYQSEDEAKAAGNKYMNEHGYSYENVSIRNRGYNKKIYPWVVKNDPNYYHKEPVYVWVFTGEVFKEGDGVPVWTEGDPEDPMSGCQLFLYTRENDAYRELWRMSHDLKGNFTIESFAVLTNKGVLILPNAGIVKGYFHNNIYDKAYFAMAWMDAYVSNRKIVGTELTTLATIQTHPEGLDISREDNSLYKYGNIFVLTEWWLVAGFRISSESDIYQAPVIKASQLLYDDWSIYQNLINIPYYPLIKR
jgi:RHS repeat-associated protein